MNNDYFPRGGVTKLDRMTTVLFDAFKKAEPNHVIVKYSASYVATFVDMARDALRLAEEINKEENEL